MELKAQFIKSLPEKTGQGKNGTWVSQDFIVSTGGQYSKEVCLSLFNKSDLLNGIQPGETITCKFDPESKEYNGRYFTNLRCYGIERETKPATAPFSTPAAFTPGPEQGGGPELPF